MTDPGILMRKLAAMRDHTERLRRRRPADPDTLRRDVDLQDAVSMSLVVAVQAALDIAMHVAAERGLGIPATYAESFKLLEQHGLVDAATSAHLQGMAALRNRIAHGYATLDFGRLWNELPTGIQAFEQFARSIAGRLTP